jgi:hypothetical protein
MDSLTCVPTRIYPLWAAEKDVGPMLFPSARRDEARFKREIAPKLDTFTPKQGIPVHSSCRSERGLNRN